MFTCGTEPAIEPDEYDEPEVACVVVETTFGTSVICARCGSDCQCVVCKVDADAHLR